MKQFFARIFSMHPLALIAGVCLIVITIPAARWLDAERANVGAVPREIANARGAVIGEVDKVAGVIMAQVSRIADGDPKAVAPIDRAPFRRLVLAEVDAQLTGARGDLRGAFGTLQTSANQQITAALGVVDRRLGDSLAKADKVLETAEGLRQDLHPVFIDADLTLKGTTSLLSTYQALPDQLGAELRPSWLKIQPEITCRQLDGAGYGGCWHSRITALMGEAATVGGVFTKRFPEFAESITGIAGDIHTFTARAVAPRGFWGNFRDVLSTSSGVARAGAAAGLFEVQTVRPVGIVGIR